MNFKFLVSIATLALATTAMAGGPDLYPTPPPACYPNVYINAHGGFSLLNDSNPYYTSGWDAGGALGYRFDNIRFEVEGTYVQHSVRSVLATPNFFIINGGTGLFNTLQVVNVFGNIYYDFDFGNRLIPYLGAGIGWEKSWSNLMISGNPNILVNRPWNLDNDGTTFQGIAGLDYAVTENLRMGVNYTATWLTEPNFNRLIRDRVITDRVFYRKNRIDSKVNFNLTLFFSV